MTYREQAKQKANDLKQELETLYGGEFRVLLTGAEEIFDLVRYGTPVVYIVGGIHSDNYHVDIWENEHSKAQLYSSGYHAIPKPVMLLVLNKVFKRKTATQLKLL